jgi:hypothetical protein
MLSVVSAHSVAGLTDVCYTSDGRFVILIHLISSKLNFSHFLTCGQDGDIHLFDTKTDQIEHIRCADQCYCLAVHVNSFDIFQKKSNSFCLIIEGLSYLHRNKSKWIRSSFISSWWFITKSCSFHSTSLSIMFIKFFSFRWNKVQMKINRFSMRLFFLEISRW